MSDDLCTAESCGDDFETRPSILYVLALLPVYYVNIVTLPRLIKAMLVYTVKNVDTALNSATDVVIVAAYTLVLGFLTFFSYAVYIIPLTALTLYSLTGAKFFPFRFTDNLSLWSVTRFVPNVGFWYKILVTFFMLYMFAVSIGTDDGSALQLYMLFLWLLYAGLTEFLSIYLGNDAAERIDPTYEPRGKWNFPRMFYILGFAKELADEPEEDMWTELMTIIF